MGWGDCPQNAGYQLTESVHLAGGLPGLAGGAGGTSGASLLLRVGVDGAALLLLLAAAHAAHRALSLLEEVHVCKVVSVGEVVGDQKVGRGEIVWLDPRLKSGWRYPGARQRAARPTPVGWPASCGCERGNVAGGMVNECGSGGRGVTYLASIAITRDPPCARPAAAAVASKRGCRATRGALGATQATATRMAHARPQRRRRPEDEFGMWHVVMPRRTE